MSYWLHFTMPEQASKTWENLRENLVRIEGDDVKIDATGWETLDPGNIPAVPGGRGQRLPRRRALCDGREQSRCVALAAATTRPIRPTAVRINRPTMQQVIDAPVESV